MITSHRRGYDVILAPDAHWVGSADFTNMDAGNIIQSEGHSFNNAFVVLQCRPCHWIVRLFFFHMRTVLVATKMHYLGIMPS